MKSEDITPELRKTAEEFQTKYAGFMKKVAALAVMDELSIGPEVPAFLAGSLSAIKGGDPTDLDRYILMGWIDGRAKKIMFEEKFGTTLKDIMKGLFKEQGNQSEAPEEIKC